MGPNTDAEMTKERPRVLSYLLRLWRVGGEEGKASSPSETVWWASLESARDRETWHFQDLDELFNFLREEAGILSDEKPPGGAGL